MALEAGSLMHEVFAAVRLWQLQYVQDLPEHALVNANRIFGQKKWRAILKEAGKAGDDEREHLLELCYAVLHSFGWVDNPDDKVRTMSNMELACIHYVDLRLPHMAGWPIYVADERDPNAIVGIEQPFDVVFLFEDGRQIRFIGTIDGLVYFINRGNRVHVLDENKTASRIDTGWQLAFDLSHQVTSYCAACTSVFGFPVYRSRVTGLKIKPTNKGEDAVPIEPLVRTESSFQNCGAWLRHSVEMFESYSNDYENAPRYTHSCNRYFRPCALLSFCGDTAEGRREQWDQMIQADPTPSERAVTELG